MKVQKVRTDPFLVDDNGNVVWIDEDYTTKAYENAVFKLMVHEASHVARQLRLPDDLTIAETNAGAYVTPFGFNLIHQSLGSVSSRKYCYYFAQGFKFNEVVSTDYDEICIKLRRQVSLPVTLLNTNLAYDLAAKWMKDSAMDLGRLNQDCKLHLAVSPFWNGLDRLGDVPKDTFVPIYYVWWTSPQNDRDGYGDVAYVELFAPTKMLLQLCVYDPKYILGKPLSVTNLESLLPGTAPVILLPPVKEVRLPPAN